MATGVLALSDRLDDLAVWSPGAAAAVRRPARTRADCARIGVGVAMIEPGHLHQQRHRHRMLFDEIAARILGICHPKRIIVFGSFARGSEGPNSDVDVLVVDDQASQRRERSVQLRHALRGMGVPIDVIVATSQDLQRYGDAIGLIYGTAMREGMLIYEQPGARFA